MLHLSKNNFTKLDQNKNYRKVKDNCHYTSKYRNSAFSICNLKVNVLNEISAVFHNDSNYYYHFIKEELANGLRESLNVLGKIQKSTKCFPFQ